MARPQKYPEEVIQRGIRLVFESGRPISHVARDLGLPGETLRKRVRRAEVDEGRREGMTTQEREDIRQLKRENVELRRANEILKSASLYFASELDRPTEMSAFIDEHRARFGVEPICETLGVSASAYYRRATGQRSARCGEDERLLALVRSAHEANYGAYGYRRMWRLLDRHGETVGRDRVARLMRSDGLQGAKRRGKPWRTTQPARGAAPRPDLVCRDFSAAGPDELWVADLSYLRCWEGVAFFSFVIDAYSRRVVGWQLAGHMRTTLVLDALRMALGTRQSGADVALVHHSDRGSQLGLNRSSQHRCC